MKHNAILYITPLILGLLADTAAAQSGESKPSPAGDSVQAEIVRSFPPLSVRGVNYYPRQTPWGGMWPMTPPEVWEHDMALAASLGINTIRTFVLFSPELGQPGLMEKDGTPTPAYLQKIDKLLAAAWRHRIRTILCLEYDQSCFAVSGTNAMWKQSLTAVITAHRNDGRVLLWDVMNEPEDRPKWTEGTRSYLREAMPLIHRLDTNHLTTVGMIGRIDLLKDLGLPDVLQYHEYCPKAELFEKGPARVSQSIAIQHRVGGDRPLLIGEFGMSTAGDPKHGAQESLRGKIGHAAGSEAEQEQLYQVVLTAAEKEQVAGVLCWCLHDYPIDNPNEAQFGLVRADGTLKPAAHTLQTAFERWRVRQ